MTDQMMTIKEVADYLKVHERTVYRLAAKGELPGFKVATTGASDLRISIIWIKARTGSGASDN